MALAAAADRARPPSLFSDELLRHLIAVGHVDVLVGVPTLDNAASVGGVVRAVHESFAGRYLRERTVLLNSDGGSTDGTPGVVREASFREGETVIAGLRTIHRISVPEPGLPGRANALRTLFAAAELSQARAVAVLDADGTGVTAEWVERLVDPVLRDGVDFVAPAYARHPLEGPLVTQLVRPLARAAYGRPVLEPLARDFACSPRFASHCLKQATWEGALARHGIDLWLPLEALAGGFRCAQAALGPRVLAPRHPRPSLPDVFHQVVDGLFACLEAHAPHWLVRMGSEPVPLLGEPPAPARAAPVADTEAMAASFRSGMRDLDPVLAALLAPRTMDRLRQVAQPESGAIAFPDELWVTTAVEALATCHHGAMHRAHVIRAMVPLYLGRTASFLLATRSLATADAAAALEALALGFEQAKPQLVERWSRRGGES